MLTIAQANSFSEVLKKNGLYKDAEQIDKYILLAKHTPIEKHAGLWDWIGGKLSGWTKRIFYKNFREAYSMAKEIQKELADEISEINSKFKEAKMYLNRHDLQNWQLSMKEISVNVTPTERLAYLQDKYNEYILEMNKGIGLLSEEQKVELETEKEKQKKAREERRKKIEEERKKEEAGEEPTAEAPEGEAPTGEEPTAEAPTAEAPTGETPLTEEELARIKGEEELTPDQQRRIKKKKYPRIDWDPPKGYYPWNGTCYFFDPEFGYNRIIVPDEVFDWNLRHSQLVPKFRDRKEKKFEYFVVNPDRGLPGDLTRSLATVPNVAWVKEGHFVDSNDVKWHILSSVDEKVVDMFNENLTQPRIAEPTQRVAGTFQYHFQMNADGAMYLPLEQFNSGLDHDFIELVGRSAGTILFAKLNAGKNSEWDHVLGKRKGEGHYLMCNTNPGTAQKNTWVKIEKVNRETMRKVQNLGIAGDLEMSDIEDFDLRGIGLTKCPSCGKNANIYPQDKSWFCPSCSAQGELNLPKYDAPEDELRPEDLDWPSVEDIERDVSEGTGRWRRRAGITRLDKIIALAMLE